MKLFLIYARQLYENGLQIKVSKILRHMVYVHSTIIFRDLAVNEQKQAKSKSHLNNDKDYLFAESDQNTISIYALLLLYKLYDKKKGERFLRTVGFYNACVMAFAISVKYFLDSVLLDFNDVMAHNFNILLEDFNKIERDFLYAIDWELFIKHDFFAEYDKYFTYVLAKSKSAINPKLEKMLQPDKIKLFSAEHQPQKNCQKSKKAIAKNVCKC